MDISHESTAVFLKEKKEEKQKTKHNHSKKRQITPPQLIALSFIVMIIVGSLLLNLPIASQDGKSIGYVDALFTCTSATCVTGFTVVNTSAHWTSFGKVVILILAQLGCYGFLTFLSFGMIMTRKRVSLKDRLVIQATFNQHSHSGMIDLIKRVISITAIFEIIGTILLTFAFYISTSMTFLQSFLNGVYHSISAFCNAGIDILGENSLIDFKGNTLINFTVLFLVIAGGIGFTVWIDLYKVVKSPSKTSFKKRIKHLSLHSKIAITVTVILILFGAAFFLIVEWNNPLTFGSMSVLGKIEASFFQSINLRTAGFYTIHQSGLQDISQFFSCILMLIGGSPAGTAAGIKTVTIGIIFITSISVLKGKKNIEAFGRTIPLETLQKALTVVFVIISVVFLATLGLYFTELYNSYEHTFLDILYEVSSGVGTVGLSTGITPYLSDPGKFILMLCMFLGRLGPITVVVALNTKLNKKQDNTSYIEEKVIIG